MPSTLFYFFFFNDTATTEIYTLSLHDALPISIEPSRISSVCVGAPGVTIPPLPSGMAKASTTVTNSTAVRSCTTDTSRVVRERGPSWGGGVSTSVITAQVVVGELTAATVPRTSATTSASRKGWCAVSGNHGL